MTALLFLAIAAVISVVGGVIVWILNRNPTHWDSGIHDFSREMKALSPERRTRPEAVPPRREHYGTEEEVGD